MATSKKKDKKPLVSILMAVYKPNERWLIEQLKSLDRQDYENIELIIWDDCPEYPTDEKIFAEYITKYDYTLFRGVQNLGSNGAFEELTKKANGDYICYCDQDDIWNDDKVSVMLQRIESSGATLVCCEQYIIDENGVKTHDSITEIRKRHIWRSGEGLAKYLIADNFVTGCALIIRTDVAKKAIPFEPLLVHDQWLGIVASLNGSIEVIMEPLIGYRQHSSNQTGILQGVEDKETYYQWRIEYFLKRAEALKTRLSDVEEDIFEEILRYEEWMLARSRFYKKHTWTDYKLIKAGEEFGKKSVWLEALLPLIPGVVFKKIIRLAKKGIL